MQTLVSKHHRLSIKQLAIHLVLLMGGLLAMSPFIWMLLTSLKDMNEAISVPFRLFPARWLFSNYLRVWHAVPFGRYLLNSSLVAVAVCLGTVFTSSLAGYALARMRFPGRNAIFYGILATMMIPFEVTLIPNFVIIKNLGWYDTYAALIVPWVTNGFAIFLMRQFLLGLPADYFDAARVDGCGHWQMLWRVALPLVKPAIITTGIFAFLGSWNSLLWPLIVTGDAKMRVLQVGLVYFITDAGPQYNLLMAASAIIIAPVVALYLIAQRYFVEGVVAVGIKG